MAKSKLEYIVSGGLRSLHRRRVEGLHRTLVGCTPFGDVVTAVAGAVPAARGCC